MIVKGCIKINNMENVNRYDCGNGDGMFDDNKGYWVTHEDYKKLLDEYNKLASTMGGVSIEDVDPYWKEYIEDKK